MPSIGSQLILEAPFMRGPLVLNAPDQALNLLTNKQKLVIENSPSSLNVTSDEQSLLLSVKQKNFVFKAIRHPLVIDEVKRGIQGATGVSPIVDNLTSTATDESLSANMGRVLDEKIIQFEEILLPTSAGQTVFTLADAYRPSIIPSLEVNGVAYIKDTDYTISGTTLTWLDALFTLDTTDVLKLQH